MTDEAARRIIVEQTEETIFVEAGAGTGKTTELVGRILALIRSGVPVSRIAAITFTEKAASELAERVRKRIEASEAAAKTEEQRAVFSAALKELDQAAIQTLHSFARRLLSLYPLEAGLPPRIALRDDVEASLAFDDRWARFRDRLLDDPETERVLLRGLTTGLRLRDLEAVAESFNQNWDRLEDIALPAAAEPALDPERVLDPLRELAAMRRPGVDDSLTKRLDSVEPWLAGLDGLSKSLRASNGDKRDALELDLVRILAKMPQLAGTTSHGGNVGNSRYWSDIAGARQLLLEAEEARGAMLDGTRSWVLCDLLPRLAGFVLEGAQERRRNGELEFHDLLVLARDLLRTRPDVRRALHERFPRILIDEFQDTDPLQVELAALLAHSGEQGPVSWDQAATEAGRLFFVGDPKQSIYRFRRADIELFKRARGAFAARHVPLSKNFRCRPGIIDWVNLVCARLFDGFGQLPDGRQADWIPLQPGRDNVKPPVVHVMGGPAEDEVLMPEVRRREAEAIAAAVLAARKDNWLGQNERGKTTRYADIAILLPTRTNSPAIERALAAAGVPVRIESRSLLFAAQEIRDLTNILAAIDDPTDDVAVLAALRSPAFAMQDGDLLEHVKAGGRWDYTRETPDASPECVRDAMASLLGFHEARWLLSIGALAERVIAERRMLELAISTARPREAWRRLRFVSEQARALGDSGTVTSLRQFVHWLRTQASERVLIAEAVANEPDDDAVRILTVHASKGLEFPIVILAGLGIEPRQIRPSIAWAHDANGRETAGVHIGRYGTYFDTPGYDELWQNEKVHEALERDRLFYVAATRAKERLVVSLFHKPVKARAGNDHLSRHARRACSTAECLSAIQNEVGDWPVLQIGMALGTGQAATSTLEDTAEERETWLKAREERVARLRQAPVRAVTTLVHGDQEDDKPEPEIEEQPWRKGRAGTSIGRAVHAVMQTIDLATGDHLRETAESQALAEGIANEAAHVARLAESARTSPSIVAAVATGRYWRELYVGVPIGGMLVEGFIDLLYESPDGLVVVDYKTDSVRDEAAIDAAMERYRLQGAAYALALERALGKPVARAVFVFTEPRAEREVTDLPGAKAEIEALLAKA
jgi:ATP-dependent helicase/nuclease subunit A